MIKGSTRSMLRVSRLDIVIRGDARRGKVSNFKKMSNLELIDGYVLSLNLMHGLMSYKLTRVKL